MSVEIIFGPEMVAYFCLIHNFVKTWVKLDFHKHNRISRNWTARGLNPFAGCEDKIKYFLAHYLKNTVPDITKATQNEVVMGHGIHVLEY
jgi:hypothetical protein